MILSISLILYRYLCFWYKPNERATRMAIFAGSVAVAGAFSGLLATGISFMNGKANLSGWQWLFILEGIPAVLFGIAVWILMPNYPNDAKFLTEEERAFAVARMGPFAPNANDKHFDKDIAKKTIMEPLFWLFAVQYFLMTNSLNAFGYFAPTIVASLGFEGYVGQLLTVPPNVFGLIIIVSNCMHSDFTKERTRHVIAGLIFVGLGYLLLAVLTNWIGRYVAVFLIACTNAAVLPFLAVSNMSSPQDGIRELSLTQLTAPYRNRVRLYRHSSCNWWYHRFGQLWWYFGAIPLSGI